MEGEADYDKRSEEKRKRVTLIWDQIRVKTTSKITKTAASKDRGRGAQKCWCFGMILKI